MIAPRIGELQPVRPIEPELGGGGATQKNGAPSFGEALGDALRQVDQQMQSADRSATAFVAGEGGDLHNVLIEMEKADLSFRTAVQVRNKLIEAYQEIMRIQI